MSVTDWCVESLGVDQFQVSFFLSVFFSIDVHLLGFVVETVYFRATYHLSSCTVLPTLQPHLKC